MRRIVAGALWRSALPARASISIRGLQEAGATGSGKGLRLVITPHPPGVNRRRWHPNMALVALVAGKRIHLGRFLGRVVGMLLLIIAKCQINKVM